MQIGHSTTTTPMWPVPSRSVRTGFGVIVPTMRVPRESAA